MMRVFPARAERRSRTVGVLVAAAPHSIRALFCKSLCHTEYYIIGRVEQVGILQLANSRPTLFSSQDRWLVTDQPWYRTASSLSRWATGTEPLLRTSTTAAGPGPDAEPPQPDPDTSRQLEVPGDYDIRRHNLLKLPLHLHKLATWQIPDRS